MFINNELPDVKVVCITLANRTNKRKWMEQQFKRRELPPPQFFVAKPHKTNPKRGCLESHLAVIRQALLDGVRHLLILEDDAKFLTKPTDLAPPPADWAMLYLGGTVKDIYGGLENQAVTPTGPAGAIAPSGAQTWVHMRCWTTHAYILNLGNRDLITAILDNLDSYPEEVDRFYLNEIHPRFPAYMANPMVAIQKPGYSDIEGKEVSYEFMQDTLIKFKEPEHEIINNQYVLRLAPKAADAAVGRNGDSAVPVPTPEDQLPAVSVITPTRNRRKMFALSIRNFFEQNYPRDKLEWVIIDDSNGEPEDEGYQGITDLIKDLPKRDKIAINHITIPPNDQLNTVAYKRNLGVHRARHDVIVHMDDDDYYPPDSVMARVKVLMQASGGLVSSASQACVGCSKLGVYDIINDASTICTDGSLTLSEASMAYTREFWRKQPFNDQVRKGEYFEFIKGRTNKVVDIPYEFVMIALTHDTNITSQSRKVTDKNKININFIDTWDEETQYFMRDLARYVRTSAGRYGHD